MNRYTRSVESIVREPNSLLPNLKPYSLFYRLPCSSLLPKNIIGSVNSFSVVTTTNQNSQ